MMDDKTRDALLGGARIILDEVRNRLRDGEYLPSQKKIVRNLEQLTDVIGQLVQAVFGEDETPQDAEPMPKLRVGDRVTTIAQLHALAAVGKKPVLLIDKDQDVWEWQPGEDGDDPGEGNWWYTANGINTGYTSQTLLRSDWHPFTIFHLPEGE